ncbi:MAG: NPCBM/NEW2 domain-containing protein [Ignavibacteria bacterium]|nr:NPCBM/NEW2 domain-containing protein [Ignavibacteria bacterium]
MTGRIFHVIIQVFVLFLGLAIAQTTTSYTVESEGIARRIQISPYVHTDLLVNKYTNAQFTTQGKEFSIMINDTSANFSGVILSAEDFIIDGKIEQLNGGSITIPLISPVYGLKVRLHYSPDAAFYLHKWLEIENHSLSPCNISVIDVESIQLSGVTPVLPSQVFGENTSGDGPVFADNFFFGLEFPKQDNTLNGSTIRLRHFPGCDLQYGESICSKKAVLGASPDKPLHRLKDSFFEYIDQYRCTPIRNIKVYNTWFLLDFRQREDTLLQAIETHIKPLFDRGIQLDGFVVDDGWQDKNSLWEVNTTMIPGGIGIGSPLQKSLLKYNTKLHLWFPLTGQYGLADRKKENEWYSAHGYETGTNWSLCLALGNRIFQDKKARLIQVVRSGVTGLKADFALLGCNKKGHHHLPNAQYGMEANINGIIDIISSLRKENPNLFYYLTTAINKSPWWLGTNDVLWESFWEDLKYYSENGEPTPAQVRMSGRDEWHWQHTMKWFVPQTSYMTHGIIASDDSTDELYCSLQEMIDISILYYARGVMWSEIYVTSMNDKYWDALSDVIKWSDKNWNILTRQPAMSGGPSGHAPYYWSHFNNDSGIIVLRNPTLHQRGVTLVLNESLRMQEISGHSYKVDVDPVSALSKIHRETLGYFHYGDTISVSLKPWELKVVAIVPENSYSDYIMYQPAELDFGKIEIGRSYTKHFNITHGKDCTVDISDQARFTIISDGNGRGYTLVLNTEKLEYNKSYSGEITVRSSEVVRYIPIIYKTGLDPAAKQVYLSEIEIESHIQSWGGLGKNVSASGRPIIICGQKFDKGLGTHSNSETIFDISSYRMSSFSSEVGVDDETNGTVEFFVYRDFGMGFEKTPVFASGVMKKGDKAKLINVDIRDVKKLKITVGNGGDGINGDHADWGNARLIR